MAVFALLLLPVVGLLISQQNDTAYQETQKTVGEFSVLDTTSQTTLDSDNDGLQDWEEVLWGTDPFNSDTDNDGTTDGAEIAVGRNPLIAGPNDILSNEAPYKKSGVGEIILSETDRASRTFFEKYLTLRQSGSNLDEETRTALVNEAVEDIFGETRSAQIYDESNITIVTTSDGSLQNYGNSIIAIINSYAEQNPENEIILFEEVLRTQNEKSLKELVDSSVMYEKISKDFITVSVPEELVSIHLDLIEGYLTLSRSLQHMSKIFEDPVLGASGFKEYMETLEQLGGLTLFLKNHFNKKSISFSATEPGFVWNI